ncbi:MAG: alpha/beta fold hydrolase [Microthrixaceae bacterium]
MTDIVLVHGAFHGGWCWREVAEGLTAAGHRVLRPTLTGLGERRHLLDESVDLDTHIADIVNTIRYEELHDLVLVVHSYGGVPGVGAADLLADRISGLVLLDAMLPIDGLSSNQMRDRCSPAWAMDAPDGAAIAPPSSAVFGIAPHDRPRVDSLLTPHPAGTLTQPVHLTGAFERIPVKHFHRNLGYVAPYFDDAAARAEDAGGWLVRRHPFGHDVMLTEPAWVISAVLDAERAAAGTAHD